VLAEVLSPAGFGWDGPWRSAAAADAIVKGNFGREGCSGFAMATAMAIGKSHGEPAGWWGTTSDLPWLCTSQAHNRHLSTNSWHIPYITWSSFKRLGNFEIVFSFRSIYRVPAEPSSKKQDIYFLSPVLWIALGSAWFRSAKCCVGIARLSHLAQPTLGRSPAPSWGQLSRHRR